MEILAAVKGSGKEKRLASQFIAKFFNCFPNLSDQAIEAQFDLCEDDDVAVIITYFYQLTIKSIFICIFVLHLYLNVTIQIISDSKASYQRSTSNV